MHECGARRRRTERLRSAIRRYVRPIVSPSGSNCGNKFIIIDKLFIISSLTRRFMFAGARALFAGYLRRRFFFAVVRLPLGTKASI